MATQYLDKTGLSHFWSKIKAALVSKSGDTMTGMLTAPTVKVGNTIINVTRYSFSSVAQETVIYTGIKYVSSSHMPVVRLRGYAYGLAQTIELHIALYIYNGEFYSSRTATNLGAWTPDIYLFTYEKNSTTYVAIGLSGQIYYAMFSVDVQEERGVFGNIDTDGWTISGYTATGNIPEIGVNHCVSVAYKSDIKNPPKVNGHTVNSDVPANAVFTDTTYTPSDATPLMNGTATPGTSAKYAREGHVHPSDTTKVDKVTGKGLSTNDYTTTEKTKLGGIAEGAEVNQNAFSNVVVGSTTISADGKTDTLTLVAGSNVTLTPDATNDKVTIAATDTTYSNATSSAAGLMSAADKKALDLSHYGTCSVATAVKTVACTNFVLTTGAWIAVKFTATNTATSFTLNVNSTGAKSVYLYGSASGLANKFLANHTYLFIYDGTYWQAVGDIDTTEPATTMTQGQASAGTLTTGMLISPKVLSDTIAERAEYVAGDTLSITTGMICQGTISGATNTLSFFVPFSKVCKATSCSCTNLSLLVRSYDGIPYARSGSSGGTYTQLGSSYVSVWENGASKRTKEVNSISCTPQENGMMVQISWGYNLTKASGNTATVTANRPAAVSVQGTFTFS